jgi:DNA-binding NarL/FixJ family response regulator
MSRKSPSVRTGKKCLRVLLVDDHPMVRERLAEIINREADLVVSGEAEDRQGAIKAILAHPPDLAIIDLKLKNSDGLELIKDIKTRWSKLRMLVVSMHDESLYAERVIHAGALGYITKQEATRKILEAIRTVLAGKVYVSAKVADHLVSKLVSHRGHDTTNPDEALADRELQVFELIGDGHNTQEIARRLHIATKTVETYRARIKEKLNLKNGNDLLQLAISWSRKQ